MGNKKPSARERYAEIKRQQAQAELAKPVDENTPLFDFTAPSGMEFKLRRPRMDLFLNMGTLPTALAGNVDLKDKAAAVQAFQELPDDKKARQIELAASIVRYICVDPKIVDDPKADNEISPDDVTLEDFNALCEWSGTGGDEATRAANFRR